MIDPWIWIALIAALLGCYFASCHVALKTFSRARLADVLERMGRGGEAARLLERRPRMLLMAGTLRTCMSLMVLISVLVFVENQWGGPAAEGGWPRAWQLLIAFGIAGLLLSVFVVSIPESIGRYGSETLLGRTLPLLNAGAVVFGPLGRLLHLFDPLVRRLSGYQEQANGDDELTEEVLSVVEGHEDNGRVDEAQKEMIEAVFEFRSTTVDEIMTPRTDIKGIEVSAALPEVKAAMLECGFSRLPVYEGNIDHIVGLLYAKDMLRFVPAGDEPAERFDMRQVMREALMVPESKPVRELLAEFKARKVHIAIVLDEYGGTAGLITVEDIVEEIIGDIQDEYEPQEQTVAIQRLDEHTVEVDARMYIDDLNDELDIALPEDEDYETLGGFVFARLGHVPDVGEHVEHQGFTLTVTQAERNRVGRVRIDLPRRGDAQSDATPTGTTG